MFQLKLIIDGQQQNNDAFDVINEGKWENIKKMIKIDPELTSKKAKELWQVLENDVDVFALNKRELECYLVKEHAINTQGLPLCHISPNRPSFWEKVEVN